MDVPYKHFFSLCVKIDCNLEMLPAIWTASKVISQNIMDVAYEFQEDDTIKNRSFVASLDVAFNLSKKRYLAPFWHLFLYSKSEHLLRLIL